MKRGVTFALAVALIGSSCSSSAKPKSTGPAAKIATVRLLTHDSFVASKSVLAEFTRQTGYKVKLVQSGDVGVMVNQAILRKSHPIADALYGVDNTFLSRALDAGIFDRYTAKGLDQIPADVQFDAEQHRVTPIDVGMVCVDYDTSWFGHGDHPPAPTGFDSLTDKQYKNLTVVEDAATSSPGLAFLLATIASQGDTDWQGYWRKLRANGVRVVDSWTSAYESDFTAGGGNGDRPIVVSYSSDPAADIEFSDPHRDTSHVGVIDSTCFRQVEFAGVLHGACNTPGAQALVDFLLARKFQEDLPLHMWVHPVNPKAKLPAVFAKWAANPSSPYTMDPQTIGANRDTWINQWTDIAVR